jgi:D-beta-D-heptose 7-phosphate kinase/D-beta-D-heptose 1-phosphate adenosyltransferase
MNKELINILRLFSESEKWVLVIGDLMLDRYLIGDVHRLSPEAPVPVVLLKQQNDRVGGAANVAANLANLGIATRVAGCVGKDAEANILLALINNLGINSDAVIHSSERQTITKTRVMTSSHQIVRIDQESQTEFSEMENAAVLLTITRALLEKPSIVILSDYIKGLLNEDLCKFVIRECKESNIPVLVDPKGQDYSKYIGATALTPNKKEAAEACGVDVFNTEALLVSAKKLKVDLLLNFLAITRGDEGITLLDENNEYHLSATAKQVFDVSGAGDTVIATLAAGLIHGLIPHDALNLANIAAGIVVGKVGTFPIQLNELLNELAFKNSNEQVNKIINLTELTSKVNIWRSNKQKLVFTNGCFDLLHAGHVTYLEAAAKVGDKLILGLNTNQSVSKLKGPTRPVNHENDRARVLAALAVVDAVILFDEDTPLNLINIIKPDVIVKGDDYTEEQVVGGIEVKSWGGYVKLIPLVQGRSTTNILEKLKISE